MRESWKNKKLDRSQTAGKKTANELVCERIARSYFHFLFVKEERTRAETGKQLTKKKWVR